MDSEPRGWEKPHLELVPKVFDPRTGEQTGRSGFFFVGRDTAGRIQAFVPTDRQYSSVQELLSDAEWPEMKRTIEDGIRMVISSEVIAGKTAA
jgi:hypothetical protein